jgi:DNA polymerase I-like protein with 3'-5' exonuclease and polymerase domains
MLDFRVLLPIHDALLFEVKNEHVDMFITVIKACMGTMNTIPGTNYSLGVDVEVMERWGEKH